MKPHRFFIAILLFLLGCRGTSTADETPAATMTPTLSAGTTTPVPTEDIVRTPVGSVTLRIWLPPLFDPGNGSSEGSLLQARIDAFATRRTGVRVEVRVKALDGPGGLLDSLAASSAVAPLALPDLVVLPRHSMETAAIKGLLHSYDGMTTSLEDADWYDFSRQLSRLQNSIFGLPIAGDALLLIYRPATIGEPPANWATALETTGPLVFPAADPQALLSLTLYQAAGGSIMDELGRPSLNVNTLTDVLTIFQQAEGANLMPYWLTQYETDSQSWEAYEENQAQMVVTWASRYLSSPPVDSSAAPLPTVYETPYTLATGWVWALTSPNPERQTLSVELAEFLTASDFLSAWTAAAGYLPPRPSAVAAWENTPMQAIASQIAPSAHLLPSLDILSTLGSVLQQTTVEVLKEQTEPAEAAQAAVEKLGRP